MTPGPLRHAPTPREENPFALLQIEPRWRIEESELRLAHLRLAGRLHPDRIPPGSAREAAAIELARVNEAAANLADPLRRAQILLSMAGGAPSLPPPMEFLARMISLREELQDSERAMAALVEARSEIGGIASELDQVFGALLTTPPAGPANSDEARTRASALIVRWKYLHRLIEEVAE